LTIQNWLL